MGESPIQSLVALYDVVKKTSMDYENHAKAQTCFETVLGALEDGNDAPDGDAE